MSMTLQKEFNCIPEQPYRYFQTNTAQFTLCPQNLIVLQTNMIF